MSKNDGFLKEPLSEMALENHLKVRLYDIIVYPREKMLGASSRKIDGQPLQLGHSPREEGITFKKPLLSWRRNSLTEKITLLKSVLIM